LTPHSLHTPRTLPRYPPSHIPGRASLPGLSPSFVGLCRDISHRFHLAAAPCSRFLPVPTSLPGFILGIAALATLLGYLPRSSASTCTSTAVSEASLFSSSITRRRTKDNPDRLLATLFRFFGILRELQLALYPTSPSASPTLASTASFLLRGLRPDQIPLSTLPWTLAHDLHYPLSRPTEATTFLTNRPFRRRNLRRRATYNPLPADTPPQPAHIQHSGRYHRASRTCLYRATVWRRHTHIHHLKANPWPWHHLQ
jgi:hypothetical protein